MSFTRDETPGFRRVYANPYDTLPCSGALAVRNKIKFFLRGTWVVCMALLIVILAPLLLCFKLQGGILSDSTTWAVTFIPIW